MQNNTETNEQHQECCIKKRGTIGAGAYEWVTAIGIVAIMILLYRMIQSTGLIDAISPSSTDITFGVALLIGIVASLSSCMATIGGVVVAFAQRYAKKEKASFLTTARPHIAFHIGRIVSFFVLGAALGAIGGTIHISVPMIAAFNIAIAVIMAWLGLNILGVVPSIARMGIRTPDGVAKFWHTLSGSEHPATPFAMGGLSFFLPCGFTQSMQLFALASGSAWIGGASLALFAIGTMPALLALGVASGWSSTNNMSVFKKVAGLVVILFAVATFNAGHALWGTAVPTQNTGTPNTTVSEPIPTGEEQVVRTRITGSGFDPETIELKKGIPTKWIISAEQVSGCTNRIIIPSLGISKDIEPGENVVYFTPKEDGKVPFSCWMGMVRGSFVVE